MEQTISNTQSNIDSNVSRKDVYQQVTETIIRQMEAGTIPWQQPWKSDSGSSLKLPKNAITGKSYRGINIVLLWSAATEKRLVSNEWASFKQWSSKKEAVRKGEKGNLIVYTDTFEKEVEGEMKKIPFLKSSVVFNRCQLASYDPTAVQPKEEYVQTSLIEKVKTVDDFVENTFANIEHHDGDAYYIPLHDKIFLPKPETFIDTKDCSATENYYSVMLHEMTHWTGHPKRLDRKLKTKFGSDAYAEEELVAELGAAFLAADFEITTPKNQSHATYIKNWLRVLKGNKQFVISAASEASKAVEFMKDMQPLKFNI